MKNSTKSILNICFVICLMICFFSFFSCEFANAEIETAKFIVTANSASVFESADFYSAKKATLNHKAEVLVEIVDGEVNLVIDGVYYIDCFQDALLQVNCLDEYVEDVSLDEEIVMNVNPNYIETNKQKE